jgi:Membrane protein involved in colicin uptake
MLDWLTWLLWTSEIVFLAASTPHIATYFEHFDNPTTFWGNVYSWLVGYGLALTIDGVTFVVLMSLVVAIKFRRPWWLTSFLVFALLLISSLSWFINWQYDLVFSSSTFASADSIQVHAWALNTSIGNLNPLIGGAFPLLSVLYALVAKALEVDESALIKTALTPEQFESEKQRLIQEQELKDLKASHKSGKGLLSVAKETLIGQEKSPDELLESGLPLLREARDLLLIESQEQALQALSGHLKISNKQALPLLIEARSIIAREDHEQAMAQLKAENEERERLSRRAEEECITREKLAEQERLERERREQEAAMERARLDHEQAMTRLQIESEERERQEQADREAEMERTRLAQQAEIERAKAERDVRLAQLQADREERERQEQAKQDALKIKVQQEQADLLNGLTGRSTVSLEEAAAILEYDTRYIVRLRNEGKLKHAARRDDQITVASIRAYQANHKRRNVSSNGHSSGDTDPLGMPVLNADARQF